MPFRTHSSEYVHKMRLLALNRQELIYLLLKPLRCFTAYVIFRVKSMIVNLVVSLFRFATETSNERQPASSIEESKRSAKRMNACSLACTTWIHNASRIWRCQIDAICFVACVRLRLIYKQPFQTRSNMKHRFDYFFVHSLSLARLHPFGTRNQALAFEINKWNRLVLVFMVCLEL